MYRIMNILRRFYDVLLNIVSRIILIHDPVPVYYDATRQQMQKIREEHARNQEQDYSHIFRQKSQFDLIRVSFIVVGLEFAYAAETAFVSPTLLEIGIEHKHMTLVWSLSPFLALVFSPILGSISDKCRLYYGRRRPMILTFSVLIIAGLLLFSFGKSIGIALGDELIENFPGIRELVGAGEATNYSAHYYKYAAIVTVCGTILLDFSADIIVISARIYLLDVCIIGWFIEKRPKYVAYHEPTLIYFECAIYFGLKDQARALSVFSMMAGIGGFFGYSITGINWEITRIGKVLGGNIKTVIAIVITLVFFSCVISLTSFREIPLPLMEKDELLRPLTQTVVKQEIDRKKNAVVILKEESELDYHEQRNRRIDVEEQMLLLENDHNEQTTIIRYLKSIFIMPRLMQSLCLTNLLSWMAFVSYCLYFTDFVGETVFMGDPMAPPDSESLMLYQSGVRFGCWGLAVYALSCSMYSMVIENLIRLFGLKFIYVGGLTIFGLSMFLLATFPSQLGVLLLSIPSGIIYSTMLTIPFLLMAKYHASGSFIAINEGNCGSSNCRGLGTDMAMLSCTTCISQVIISLIAGSVVDWFGSSSAVIYLASSLGLISAFSASKVLYIDSGF